MEPLEKKVNSNKQLFDEFNSFLGKQEWYFKPRSIELWGKGRIYRMLGVSIFKKKFLDKFVDYIDNSKTPTPYRIGNSTVENIKSHEKQARFNEAVHMPIGLLTTGAAFYFLGDDIHELIKGDPVSYFSLGVWACLLPLALTNLYLGLTQRYNRARLYGVLNHRDKKADKKEDKKGRLNNFID